MPTTPKPGDRVESLAGPTAGRIAVVLGVHPTGSIDARLAGPETFPQPIADMLTPLGVHPHTDLIVLAPGQYRVIEESEADEGDV